MSAHVFISYVHEDNGQIDRICEVLRAAGVEVWRDRDCIAPGLRWRDAIRHAIGQGAFFLACFSRNYWARQKSFMNTELGLAIEELTEFRRDQSWFVAVRLDDCDVPEWSIGAGETLKHLQHVDLFVDWADGMRRILAAVAPFASAELNARARFWVSAERRIDRALQLYDEWNELQIDGNVVTRKVSPESQAGRCRTSTQYGTCYLCFVREPAPAHRERIVAWLERSQHRTLLVVSHTIPVPHSSLHRDNAHTVASLRVQGEFLLCARRQSGTVCSWHFSL